ncbi:hypothetical protein L218DRAFT_877186 [Marasmius fiardii PR-910]|nr:hypothetical protein L218DRAFT_877186 [Marasmius fiardii PR-910]
MNPFAQGGWTGSGSSSQYPEPSIYGALPFSAGSSSSPNDSILTFTFTSFDPNITNCIVLGPNSRPFFRIIDNSPSTGFTLFQNNEGRSIAIIEWMRSATVVEIRDIVQKQLVSSWLAVSQDRSYRTMIARNRSFVWTTRENYVGLFTPGPSSQCYAKVIRGEESVVLQITAQAVQLGLLESCVVAVVLLQSGRQID